MRRTILNAIRGLLLVGGWAALVSILWVVLLGLVDPPVTWVMVEQRHEQGKLERVNMPLERMSRSMPLAVIASEDQRFMTHNGFSWTAIERAMESNKKGKRVKGASTISQQTAKNVFLWPGRTWVRKGMEVWFTVLIEAIWSKERILEVYLNVAELGKGVFGAEAAAQHCFNVPASRLTKSQCALLAATLPSPRRYSCSRPSAYVGGRQQWVLRQMRNVGDVLDPVVLAKRKAAIEAEERRKEEKEERRKEKKRKSSKG
jgi:monofunctional biosynthetic peptidoglycan transglycosylase